MPSRVETRSMWRARESPKTVGRRRRRERRRRAPPAGPGDAGGDDAASREPEAEGRDAASAGGSREGTGEAGHNLDAQLRVQHGCRFGILGGDQGPGS